MQYSGRCEVLLYIMLKHKFKTIQIYHKYIEIVAFNNITTINKLINIQIIFHITYVSILNMIFSQQNIYV